MAFQISPGVNVSEVDLTTVVPSVLTTSGAFAGYFNWGPANIITSVSSEIVLTQQFGKPDSNSAVSFFTAANFLAYGNNLNLVRTVGSGAVNALANTNATAIQVANESIFQASYLSTNLGNAYGSFMARYPGALGNSLSISICDNSTNFSTWNYKSYFTSAPSTSSQTASAGGLNDEMHIVVIDTAGLFTGSAGTVLETYPFVSKATNATVNGTSNYYKQVIFNNSKYVYAVDPVDYANTSATWGQTNNTTFRQLFTVQTVNLSAGQDVTPTDGNIESGYSLFVNKDTLNISLVLTGNASANVQNYVISNIANGRGDCVAFISPPLSSVLNQSGYEATNIISWLGTIGITSSYAFADSGWKYQYDKYNNVYRWIPLNGDVAGLCVYTDTIKDPWFSPAGYNRGQIKNAIKLAWNPTKSDRDTIYAGGVNPVVSFPGQGIILFGDKTLQSKPSAFDRINVRRLFIVLEKTISTAAKFSLFELNDDFTRAQFVALVTPFLRDVQGRRGITDFQVVCDTTNNTPQVINSNQFVGDIYIKPARSINFIQLNFVAVNTGVDFSTIINAA